MKKTWITAILLAGALGYFLLGQPGCEIGSSCRAKFERTDTLQADLPADSEVSAATAFGSITVEGRQAGGFELEAKITVQAPTDEKAREIADKVKIKLTQDGAKLAVTVDKPSLPNNCCVAADFHIKLPQRTHVNAHTSYGSIKITDIIGPVRGETSFAGVTCENIQGPIDVDTSYGSINLDRITGEVKAKTSFGSIKVENIEGAIRVESSYGGIKGQKLTTTSLKAQTSFAGIDIDGSAAGPDLNAAIETSYGSIDFIAPPPFAGEVEMETSYGSIHTDRQITVSGNLGDNHIKGAIGSGQGKLRLETSFGSVKLK
jgi:hypothetical protein